MQRKFFVLVIALLISVSRAYPQAWDDTGEITGLVVDIDNQNPLPYANIYVLNKAKGFISNEHGHFSIDLSEIEKDDTLCFQYIGYKTARFSAWQLDTVAIVGLKEEIYDLNETLVFGDPPDPRSIVKKVIQNKASNYKKTSSVGQTFIRRREMNDFEQINLHYRKSSIPGLDKEKLKLFEDLLPRHRASFSDFFGNIYLSGRQEDSVKLKVDPVRSVELKEEDIAGLEQFETMFEDFIANTTGDEYWRVRSGIFSQKIDSADQNVENENDTVNKNRRELKYYSRSIGSQLKYISLEDKDQWEFLYETGKYNYLLTGGTVFNGEEVYIIDFNPKGSGLYTGRMYISISTFALIRADYAFVPGKTGRDIQLLGIGYAETGFSGSIYFEKRNDNYRLKYFSNRSASDVSVKRSLEISKKSSRALFDKELMTFKVDIDLKWNTENSIEYYILDDRDIDQKQFDEFRQEEFMDIIYVKQFDDKLWSGYSIIEPTEEMKAYKKQDVDFNP